VHSPSHTDSKFDRQSPHLNQIMNNFQRNEPILPRQRSNFAIDKDNHGSINEDAYMNKQMNFIDKTIGTMIGTIGTDIERNKERLVLIRERFKQVHSSTNCTLHKDPISTVIITPSSSELLIQIENPISDIFPCSKQDNSIDFEDFDSSALVRTDTTIKTVDFQCSSTESLQMQSTSSTTSVESFSDASTERSIPALNSSSSVNKNCDENAIDHKSETVTPIDYMNLRSSSARKSHHQTQATILSPANVSSCELPQHLRLGLTLCTMQKLLDRLPHDAVKACNDQIPTNDAGTPTLPLNDEINGYVNQHFIVDQARIEVDNLSVCERIMHDPDMALGVGDADVFVCWDLSTGIQTLIDALREFLEIEGLPKYSTFFWIRDYVVRQSNVISDLKWLEYCVKDVGLTVLLSPCDSLLPLKKVHCIQELYYTKVSNSKFKLFMGTKQQNWFERNMRCTSALVVESIFNVDIDNAECQDIYEKKMVLNNLEMSTTLIQCNKIVTELLQKEFTNQGLRILSSITEPGDKSSILVDNITMLLRKQRRFKEAQLLYEEHLRIHCRNEGSKNQESLSTMYKIANLLREQGNFNEAQHLLERTLAEQLEVFGRTHEDTLTSMATLGLILSQLELFDDAILLYKEALTGRRLTLGLRHPLTLTTINNLGTLLYQQHLFDEAVPLLMESLQRSHDVLGPKHPDTLCSISNLAVQLKDQGLFTQAWPLYEKALSLKREVLGSEHSSTLRSIHNFAVFLKQRGQYEKAQILYVEAIKGRKQVLGPLHPHTINSINCLESMSDCKEFH